MIARALTWTPEQRVSHSVQAAKGISELSAASEVASFDPGQILRALEAHRVRYVVTGSLAAVAGGAPIFVSEVGVTPERERQNLERIMLALSDLDARLPHSSGREVIDRDLLATAERCELTTSAGDLELVFSPSGTSGFGDLRRDAQRERIAGIDVPVAALADVIRSKQATGREKDSMQLPILRRTLEHVRERERR